MSQRTAVLFANEAFYRAFANRDKAAMKDVWAEHVPVSCVHPGWHPITTREDVMEAWDAILSNPETPEIECFNTEVMIHDNVAIVTCHERVEGQFLSATNVLILHKGRWRMIHHHAGPVALEPETEEEGFEEPGKAPIN